MQGSVMSAVDNEGGSDSPVGAIFPDIENRIELELPERAKSATSIHKEHPVNQNSRSVDTPVENSPEINPNSKAYLSSRRDEIVKGISSIFVDVNA
jgi:hypothetical protein